MFEGFPASWELVVSLTTAGVDSWWLQPTHLKKYAQVYLDHFPSSCGKKPNPLKPPTSFFVSWWNDLAKLIILFHHEISLNFLGISFPKPPPFLGAESSGEFPPCFPNKKATQVPRTCSRYHLPRALDFSRRYPPNHHPETIGSMSFTIGCMYMVVCLAYIWYIR